MWTEQLNGVAHVQVRVVCSANGHFIKQASGHYEYEGGDTRLVGISSASSLPSLKEALNRVVTKAGTGSTSASGSPEVSPCSEHLSMQFLQNCLRLPQTARQALQGTLQVCSAACLDAWSAPQV